jgi:uncharacterized protein
VIQALLLAAGVGFTIPPTPDHFVTDNAGALSESTRSQLENELQAYERATGHQIIVYIGQTTGGVPLETWTGEAADHWKVGRKGRDDGAVLFLFMRDHRIRIEVGYGLESKLTDADASRIITDDITPKMRAGDPDAAVSAGVADMLTTVAPSYKLSQLQTPAPHSESTSRGNTVFLAVFFLFFAGIFLWVAFVIISQIIAVIRYGYLVVREGPKAADRDMKRSPFFGGIASGWSSSGGGGGSFGDGGGGGFSGGGGSFGGGGASGGW